MHPTVSQWFILNGERLKDYKCRMSVAVRSLITIAILDELINIPSHLVGRILWMHKVEGI
jgi:hypothetical protein